MNSIIKWLVCTSVALCAAQASFAVTVRIYHGQNGEALLIDVGEDRSFLIAGGAIPRGADTAGDCFAKATLKLKKSPNYFEGDLDPVRNEIMDVSAEDVAGKGVGVYVLLDRIRVGNVETDGVCADGIDFSGNYREILSSDVRYKTAFLYFMRLANQDASHSSVAGDIKGAIKELKPFVESYKRDWRKNNEDKKTIDDAVSNYKDLTRK